MTITWKKGANPQPILDKLEKVTSRTKDGNVSYDGFDFHEASLLLYTLYNFPDDLPEADRKIFHNKSIFNTAKKGKLNPEQLLREIKRLYSEQKRLPDQKYFIATTLSIDRFRLKTKFSSNGKLFFIEPYFPKSYHKEISLILDKVKYHLYCPPPTNYVCLRVGLIAKTTRTAYLIAIEEIDYIRGVWNLLLNKHMVMTLGSGKQKPINEITLGPIHTVHLPGGYLVRDEWWYEPHYLGPLNVYKNSKEPDWFKRQIKDTNFAIRNTPYAQQLKIAFIRYTRALDEINLDFLGTGRVS